QYHWRGRRSLIVNSQSKTTPAAQTSGVVLCKLSSAKRKSRKFSACSQLARNFEKPASIAGMMKRSVALAPHDQVMILT
ncbi:hypothetical protein AB9F39_38900, partial [Rhizobium leguminosarum]